MNLQTNHKKNKMALKKIALKLNKLESEALKLKKQLIEEERQQAIKEIKNQIQKY